MQLVALSVLFSDSLVDGGISCRRPVAFAYEVVHKVQDLGCRGHGNLDPLHGLPAASTGKATLCPYNEMLRNLLALSIFHVAVPPEPGVSNFAPLYSGAPSSRRATSVRNQFNMAEFFYANSRYKTR
jgi:hypothetical protein